MNQFCGPFYGIAIPLGQDGEGPCKPEDAVVTLHEVWDQACQSVCACPDEFVARFIADSLNAGTVAP